MSRPISDAGVLITIASIIAGFGVAVLMFRLQRELSLPARERWLACADWLTISSTLIALLFVIMPLILFGSENKTAGQLAGAATCSAVILLAGYVPSILAHYRLIFRGGRNPDGPRGNPEPSERGLIILTCLAAIAAVAFYLVRGFAIGR